VGAGSGFRANTPPNSTISPSRMPAVDLQEVRAKVVVVVQFEAQAELGDASGVDVLVLSRGTLSVGFHAGTLPSHMTI
jgi:hypothetical protein